MPIPAALLQRLKKRGLIKNEPQEEIIAESYDDETTHQDHHPIIRQGHQDWGQQTGQGQNDPGGLGQGLVGSGAPGCPNKCNPYHVCVQYCWDRWGDGILEDSVDSEYNRRRLRMLAKYPVPANWREIYDPGTGRYYYWNLDNDEVCWLSPTHPKAQITFAACRLAKSEWDKINQQKPTPSAKVISSSFSSKDIVGSTTNRKRKDSVGAGGSSGSDDNRSDDEEPTIRRKGGKKVSIGKSRKMPKDLDPMDPAAYSDIPRGKWSAGLESRGDAKTGVDTTAVGPLFQQRPYPSPGAILRQNMEKQREAAKKGGKRFDQSSP